ncbi:hypothetical protein [Gelidibacter maritimus]|uniref:Uncharacterized protein n=1 Tax=Gelidibacter maritimus TaxID=2761487 RepID=A0A7W2M5J7_9FLAO|nr:hypothetical protein [Gelidibacter maritimus]MBA6153099.1 hypothetical protein [Gelidibacter maritimus]
MRNLDLDEITDKIATYASDIRYADRNHLQIKITQFFNFLYEQPISNRTLERISEDFKDLNNKRIEVKKSHNRYKESAEFIDTLSTREIQGAFAYFEIKDKFEIERKFTNFYIELAYEWYEASGNYNEWQELFKSYFFEPFIELIEWYFRESKIKQEYDYFSREEISQIEHNFENLKSQISKLEFGQEIIFNETDEIKDLISGLNKKNWTEIIKAKFNDMILGKIISLETAELLIKTITGENIKLK